MVFTKTDKIGKQAIEKNLEVYREEMLKSWEELPQIFVTSAEKGIGRDDLLDFIASTLSTAAAK
jgi:GTP-binding protein